MIIGNSSQLNKEYQKKKKIKDSTHNHHSALDSVYKKNILKNIYKIMLSLLLRY